MLQLLMVFIVAMVQQPHTDHAAQVMGFDQDRTAHHFYLYSDGGAIDVAVKDSADAVNRDAIRAHLPHITMMFGSGNFDAPMLVHDTRDVPGIDVLAARREHITYRYSETPLGGRVDIVTTDRDALAALHEFLRYQIREHKTGDRGTVVPRR
jgi:hypothetical protein